MEIIYKSLKLHLNGTKMHLAKKKLNIELFSTPFSVRAVKFLEKFKVKLYKISSFEITDLLLIDEIAKTKKPVILSTGMATIKSSNSYKAYKKVSFKNYLLHCVSGYQL